MRHVYRPDRLVTEKGCITVTGRITSRRKEKTVRVVIRKYSGRGAAQLINVLEEHAASVKDVIGSIQGVAGYVLARTADGGFTVTLCEDQAGVDESTRKAKEWIAENAGDIGVGAPEVSVGDVVIQLK